MVIKEGSKLLTCVGLATVAAVTGGTENASLIASITAALSGGVAGGLGTDLVNKGGKKLSGIFKSQFPEIDGNHHILYAMRAAHLSAVHQVLMACDGVLIKPDDRRFAEALKDYLEKEKSGLDTGKGTVSEAEKTLFQDLPSLFQTGLAARATGAHEGAGDKAQEMRKAVEAEVLIEVRQGGGFGATEALPGAFANAFEDEINGWFPLFIRDAAARLKQNDAFQRHLEC